MRVLLILLFVLSFGCLFSQVEILSKDSEDEKEEKLESDERLIVTDSIHIEMDNTAAPVENSGVEAKKKLIKTKN